MLPTLNSLQLGSWKKFIHLHKANDIKKGDELPANFPWGGVVGVDIKKERADPLPLEFFFFFL